jgi:hypothetical protein
LAAPRTTLLFAAVLTQVVVAAPVLAQSGPLGNAPPGAPSSSPPRTNADTDDESPTDRRALAETLFYTARGLMDDNKIAKACKKFRESYRLDPAAGTLLNLAVCHEKEGRLASAWGEFRQAQADARRSNRSDREQLAKDAIARIEPELPYLTIIVPKGARVAGLGVQRNGVPLEEGAWETELPIDPGTNEITATAPQYKQEKKLITIEKRQHLTVTLDPLEPAPVERPPAPYWTSSRVIGIAAIGAGAVAIGVGSVFGVNAMNNKSKSDSSCPTFDGELRCQPGGASAMSTAQSQAWVADLGIGIGAAAVVTGGLLMLFGGAHQESGPAPAGAPATERARPQGAWRLDFTGGPRGAQGLLTRSF